MMKPQIAREIQDSELLFLQPIQPSILPTKCLPLQDCTGIPHKNISPRECLRVVNPQ